MCMYYNLFTNTAMFFIHEILPGFPEVCPLPSPKKKEVCIRNEIILYFVYCCFTRHY